jgi:hypothetical protein
MEAQPTPGPSGPPQRSESQAEAQPTPAQTSPAQQPKRSLPFRGPSLLTAAASYLTYGRGRKLLTVRGMELEAPAALLGGLTMEDLFLGCTCAACAKLPAQPLEEGGDDTPSRLYRLPRYATHASGAAMRAAEAALQQSASSGPRTTAQLKSRLALECIFVELRMPSTDAVRWVPLSAFLRKVSACGGPQAAHVAAHVARRLHTPLRACAHRALIRLPADRPPTHTDWAHGSACLMLTPAHSEVAPSPRPSPAQTAAAAGGGSLVGRQLAAHVFSAQAAEQAQAARARLAALRRQGGEAAAAAAGPPPPGPDRVALVRGRLTRFWPATGRAVLLGRLLGCMVRVVAQDAWERTRPARHGGVGPVHVWARRACARGGWAREAYGGLRAKRRGPERFASRAPVRGHRGRCGALRGPALRTLRAPRRRVRPAAPAAVPRAPAARGSCWG